MSQINGLPPLPQCFDGLIQVERTVSETSQGEIHEGTSHCLNFTDRYRNESVGSGREVHDYVSAEEDNNVVEELVTPNYAETPVSKLNTTLGRLRQEMVIHYTQSFVYFWMWHIGIGQYVMLYSLPTDQI